MRSFLLSCPATILLTFSAALAATDLDTCIQLAATEWSGCLERIGGTAFDARELRKLEPRIAEDPGRALEFLGLLDGALHVSEPDSAAAPDLRAGMLDARAEAHRLLGNTEVAAEAALAALEAQSGMRGVEWWTAAGGRRWIAPLDNPLGRNTRAARLLLEIDRVGEARALLATALRFGADAEAEALWSASGGGPLAGLDENRAPIVASPWFPRLPRAVVPMVEGEPFVLDQALGRVLILDFWASWCEPCLKELPALGRLYDGEKQRGLQVILINMGEAPEHALRFARGLDLRMPVGFYDEALADAFDAAALPTVIVADRDGRVRARWDGYVAGLEQEVAALARRLMGPDSDPPGERVGQVLRGGDLLRVRWARTAAGEVDSLAIPATTGSGMPASLVALAGRKLSSYGPGGALTGSVDRPRGAGRMRQGDLDGDGRDELLTFRPGSSRLLRLDTDTGRHEPRESPAALLDLTVAPAREGTPGYLYLATLTGLHRMSLTGETIPIAGPSDLTGLTALSGPGESRLAVTDRNLGLCMLDPANPEATACPGVRAWQVVAGAAGRGVGCVPQGAAASTGRLLGGEQGEVVLITSTGQAVILDVESGAERWRARVPGLRAMAVGDLDGDGRDELALAVGDRILVLSAEPAESPASHDGRENRQD